MLFKIVNKGTINSALSSLSLSPSLPFPFPPHLFLSLSLLWDDKKPKAQLLEWEVLIGSGGEAHSLIFSVKDSLLGCFFIKSSLPTTLCHYLQALASKCCSDNPQQPFFLSRNKYYWSAEAIPKAARNVWTYYFLLLKMNIIWKEELILLGFVVTYGFPL